MTVCVEVSNAKTATHATEDVVQASEFPFSCASLLLSLGQCLLCGLMALLCCCVLPACPNPLILTES